MLWWRQRCRRRRRRRRRHRHRLRRPPRPPLCRCHYSSLKLTGRQAMAAGRRRRALSRRLLSAGMVRNGRAENGNCATSLYFYLYYLLFVKRFLFPFIPEPTRQYDEQELEAETLSNLIQQRVYRQAGITALSQAGDGLAMRHFMQGLGMDEGK